MSTATLAVIIFLVILAQVALVVMIGLYRRKQKFKSLIEQTYELAGTSQSPESDISTVKPGSSSMAQDDFKEFIVVRRELENKNQSICSFYLLPVDGKPLPTFKPGQFLTFKLQIDGPVKGKAKSVVRCYSLSDAPRTDYYRVSIKRVPAPAGLPDVPAGASSNFFHDHVQQDSRLMIKPPSGHFHLMDEMPLPVVLIGSGIGITPMLSMLNALLESKTTREVWLYYGVKNGDEHIMKKHFQALDRAHDNFHLHICYSAPNETDVEGPDYQHKGRIGIPLLQNTLKLMRYQFYVCGPKSMMESLIPGLEELGVSSHDIYYESFGPASLGKHKKIGPHITASDPITITFGKSGKSLAWDSAVGSLLEFAENNGIDVDSGCRAGSCGSCQTAVSAGETEYNQQPDADVEPGHCLLCITTPKGNITLDA